MREKARQARNSYQRDWRKKNPEKVRAINERYWARRLGVEKGDQNNGIK